MENIAFVLWVCLWPLSMSICSYLLLKEKKFKKEEIISSSSTIELIVWILVAIWLYK